ncbi:T9SS type A sorting domain-containing protein [Hymenobacter setariae]|uniref:T9SS type A sorting domain-containing protein n=1 Tax=Hymenobacter setariae TaxID=2594794 RepID=A0A558BPM7_9BACT|nr:T9SS type A sorting domain-containing protein [Hymenobacter setariae]TVT38474.1 T9SS type A sorting domain-containing protein [Hymenobacter setariae]
MQKPLNTHKFSRSLRWRGKFLNTKVGLLLTATLLLLVQGTQTANAQAGFVSDFINISSRVGTNPRVTGKYYTLSNSADPSATRPFQSAFLGTFNRTQPDINSPVTAIDSLFINAEANTRASNGDFVSATQLFYRVRRADLTDEFGSEIPVPLSLASGDVGGNAQWVSARNRTNLITSTTSPGTYLLEVYFLGNATVSKSPTSIVDKKSGGFYTATFEVKLNGVSVVPSSWNATKGSNNWFDAANWSGGQIPNTNTDVTIPYVENGNYPILNRVTGQSNIAQAHNILIGGRPIDDNGDGIADRYAKGATLTLNNAQLRVFGDFQDRNAGFRQGTTSSTNQGSLTFAGTNQTIDAGLTLSSLFIQGGGVKTLTQNIILRGDLTFQLGGGVLVTRTDNTNTYNISFQNTGGQVGQIVGEDNNSYILGVVKSSLGVYNNGQSYRFNNIGIVLSANNQDSNIDADAPGAVTVIRTSGIFNEVGSGVSVRRNYEFQADADPLDFSLAFSYVTADLNGNTADNLQLYRQRTGNSTFEKLGKDTSSPGIVAKDGITGSLNAVFTLGEIVPLPVTLVSFTATPAAQGAALLRWTTASETNNKGFGIERQLGNGQAWESVGYLATGNNATGGTYTYTDKTLANTHDSPVVYYRLRQEDQDGKLNYSPVAVIARSTAAASTALQLSPVPVTGSTISLTFAEANQAGSEVSITNTQGQRLYSYTTQASSEAALSLPVERLAAGVYIVSVRVPGQAVRHARFVKL